MIAPGINLSMQALHDAAARLPRVAIQRPAATASSAATPSAAMQSGVFWGYVAPDRGAGRAHQGRVGRAA